MKITVWDDDDGAAATWKGQIEDLLRKEGLLGQKGTDVTAQDVKEIKDEFQVLHDRRRRYLEGDVVSEEGVVTRLDQTDLLVVDNDLFELDTFVDVSAEMVAARCLVYTECSYVVVLNMNPDIDFDLSLLGHADSKADLHINDQFLGNRGLWFECPAQDNSFRPWHWPLLFSAGSLQKSRVQELQDYLVEGDANLPILDYFGFSETARTRLSRSARAFLHPTRSADEISFLDFISNNVKAVDVKDGTRLVDVEDKNKIAQVCARRLAKWLSHLVLGPQDIVIDLPHLIGEFPFLVKGSRQDDLEYWNTFAALEGAPVEELTEDVSEFQFGATRWFDRPVYWREKLDTEENLDRLLELARVRGQWPVFCEDASSFHLSDDCQRFVAGYHSASDNRFLRWFDGGTGAVRYGPHSRMAM